MTKKETVQPAVEEIAFEMAEEQKPFLQSDYFIGLCEIACATVTGKEIYVSDKNLGIFNSLYFKRIFARKEMDDKGYLVGNFQLQNRYLFVYDRATATYTKKKEANVEAFKNYVNALKTGEKEYTVFSLEPVKSNVEDLSSVLG